MNAASASGGLQINEAPQADTLPAGSISAIPGASPAPPVTAAPQMAAQIPPQIPPQMAPQMAPTTTTAAMPRSVNAWSGAPTTTQPIPMQQPINVPRPAPLDAPPTQSQPQLPAVVFPPSAVTPKPIGLVQTSSPMPSQPFPSSHMRQSTKFVPMSAMATPATSYNLTATATSYSTTTMPAQTYTGPVLTSTANSSTPRSSMPFRPPAQTYQPRPATFQQHATQMPAYQPRAQQFTPASANRGKTPPTSTTSYTIPPGSFAPNPKQPPGMPATTTPNNAVRRPQWQNPQVDQQQRKMMVSHIIKMLQQRRPNAEKSWYQRLPAMAKRLETELYRKALSKSEYMNSKTLKKRLQDVARTMSKRSRPSTSPTTASSSNTSFLQPKIEPRPRLQQPPQHRFVNVADINPIMGMKNSSNNSSSQPSNPVGISTSNTVSLVTTNPVIPNKPMSLATRAQVPGKRDRDPDTAMSSSGPAKRIAGLASAPGNKDGNDKQSGKQREKMLIHQQQRLLLLRHASKCKQENCTTTPLCKPMKLLWKHIAKCKNQKCQEPHCVSSRYVLAHYHHCQNKTCQVCSPVRRIMKRSSRSPSRRITADVCQTFSQKLYRRHFDSLEVDFNPFFTLSKIKSSLEPLLKSLGDRKDSYIFAKPVDPVELNIPTYHDIIKRPMDYSTLRRRINQGIYNNLRPRALFFKDVVLVFENAMLFNAEGTYVHNAAKESMQQFLEEFKEVEAKLLEEERMDRADENHCCLCGGARFNFEPPVFYCNGPCQMRIRRNSHYHYDKDNKYHYCTKCWAKMDQIVAINPVDGAKKIIPKANFRKKKNDETADEAWVQCDYCMRWMHQICALFNHRINDESSKNKKKYMCPKCVNADLLRTGQEGPRDSAYYMDATRLKKDNMSYVLETHLNNFLTGWLKKQDPATRYSLEGVFAPVTVRCVSVQDMTHHTKPKLAAYFKNKEGGSKYPDTFPYRDKAIIMFQKIDGLDICFFGMYIQEYGDDCSPPNKRCVYISYLDSVQYFRPRALRTPIYHELICAYMKYVKMRGFCKMYIWACPPQQGGEDYILYCHPPHQKTPKSDRLRAWYHRVIDLAMQRGIAVDRSNLYVEHMLDEPDVEKMPSFAGDYWIGLAEDKLKELEEEQLKLDAKRSQKSYKKKSTKKKTVAATKADGKGKKNQALISANNRYTRSVANTMADSNVPGRTVLMQRLCDTLFTMKDDFLVVHFYPRCCGCNKSVHNGMVYQCEHPDCNPPKVAKPPSKPAAAALAAAESKKTKGKSKKAKKDEKDAPQKHKRYFLCPDCYKQHQALPVMEQHPKGSAVRHEFKSFDVREGFTGFKTSICGRSPEQIRNCVDPDEPQHSDFFNCRQDFLTLCQGNHYQFDELRRAKHSTMMVLYHMHNPSAPAFVHTCNNCRADILVGKKWSCTKCQEYDLCENCYKDRNVHHEHPLKPHAVTGGGGEPIDEQQRQQRQQAIQMHLNLLVHASGCTKPNCEYLNCKKMTALLDHGKTCKKKTGGGCNVCRRIWALLQIHARQCRRSNCPVPRCADVRKHTRFQQMRVASRRRNAYASSHGSRSSSSSSSSGGSRGRGKSRGNSSKVPASRGGRRTGSNSAMVGKPAPRSGYIPAGKGKSRGRNKNSDAKAKPWAQV